ncbi:hypothetical protein NC651_028557 [Populus alba x Populus x berolinensis]|nr:hypothetical protein NC651_028557 [Populus alba x Populus x berolinensis]
MQWKPLLPWATINYKKRKNILHVIARLILSTTIYFICFERNKVFAGTFHPPKDINAEIIQSYDAPLKLWIVFLRFNQQVPSPVCARKTNKDEGL